MPEAPALPADDRCLMGLCAALTAIRDEPIERVLAGFADALRLELAALLVCRDGAALVRALGTRDRRVAPELALRLPSTWSAGILEGRVISGEAGELTASERAGLRLGPAARLLLAPLPALEGPPLAGLLIATELAEGTWSSGQEQALRGLAAGLAGWQAARERQLLLDALPQRIAWKDAGLRHRAVNRAYARASGLTAAQLLGRGDDGDPAATRREQLGLAAATLRRLESAPLPGEREQWFEVSRIPHEGGVLVVVDEVSARVQLGQQLHAAQRIAAIGRLAGGLAAELRPITAAITAAVAAAREEPGSLAAQLDRIELGAREADDLVRQLAAFDRRQPREAIELVPGQVLLRMQPTLARLLGERTALVVVPPALRCVVRLDPRLCEQLFAALAVHLRGRLGGRGSVEVEATPQTLAADQALALALPAGEYLRLRWCLEPAAPPAELDLRLALVHTIVGLAGGALHDDGGALDVYLPRVFAAPRGELEAGPLVDLRGAETVLLVEDEPVLALTLTTALRHLGYRVCTAEDLPAALAHCPCPSGQPGRIALALLSAATPAPRELLRRLREPLPELRVLWLARGPGPAALGGDPLIVPCSFEALALRVRQALDARLS